MIKIIVIILKSLQQLIQYVTIKFMIIYFYQKKKIIAINYKYFNETFDIIIYMLLQ